MSSLRPEGSRRKVMSEINVVPYIDVMLVLVVILMVSAPFVEPSVVNLPTVAKASKAPDKVISVVVQAMGRLRSRMARNSRRRICPVSSATFRMPRRRAAGTLFLS